MLTAIHPKLPMRSKAVTRAFYTKTLGFYEYGNADYPGYLMVARDEIQIHFFEFPGLDPAENYGQVYIRVAQVDAFYRFLMDGEVPIHPNGHLETKPWGQREFSVLDPDNNLLTFGQQV